MSEAAVTAELPEQPEPRRYDLYLRHRAGFFWRLTDNGIVPGAEKLSYPIDGRMGYRRYEDIFSVNLSSAYIHRHGQMAQCAITFRNGATLGLSSCNDQGLPDVGRQETYFDFLMDFHKRLVDSGAAKTIRFTRGGTEGRMRLLYATLILVTAFFVVLPIFLAIWVRSWEPFELMLLGGLLIWPAWESANKNEPGTYDPRFPPDMLDR